MGLAAGVRGSGGSGRCRPLRCTLLRCTDRAGTTGRGKQATRGPGIGSRGENRGRSSDGGKELPGCWERSFCQNISQSICKLWHSCSVLQPPRDHPRKMARESGEHMQILALCKIWLLLVSLRRNEEYMKTGNCKHLSRCYPVYMRCLNVFFIAK